ncbi:MAG: tyrosine-type recombinase/integrase family protein [Treponema sp.]|nr:tyrosine-type recombinase/integrase family protein [Candidatus Treponema merdequi]
MGRYKEPYTLFKRGDYWYYRTYDNSGYRTTAKSTGKTSKGAAKQYCDELFLHGTLYTGSNKTFEQYATGFYNSDSLFVLDRDKPLSKGTIYGYQTMLNSKIMPFFGKMRLNEIKLTNLKEFRQKLLQEGWTASYINNVFAAFKNIIVMAVADGLINVNPFAQYHKLSTNKIKKEPFTREQLKQLYDFLLPDFRKNILLMALTGMRLSECCGVTEEDFKEKNGITYIHLTRQWDNRNHEYKPLKSKKEGDYRDIPVIPEAKELCAPFRSKSCQKYVSLFCKSILKNENISAHSVRHFFISDTKMKDLNPIKIELVAGHSLKGIEGVYTHFDPLQFPELLEWQKDIFDFLTK